VPFQVSTHVSLLARLAGGSDSGAWAEFHGRYHDLLWNFARRRGLQQVDADDIVQEVLFGVSQRIGEFAYDPSKGSFRGYLKTIAVRAIWKKLRQKMDVPAQEEGDAALGAAAADDDVDRAWEDEWRQYHLRLAMNRARGEFNGPDIAAFEAYVLQGRDAAGAAAELGMSVDQIYQAKSRILRRLRVLIAEQTAEEG
jgi:RNA polymerase sigma-70 factor, ECF subfamily